ncbi:MAG: hypothetical protein MJ188_10965 [Treponema sp.]|nr:hypothetical protein [Treponema sp.]
MEEDEQIKIFHFNKIKITDYIATSIANYGEQCGAENFLELVDMNCGAIPDGSYYQVIDRDGAEQFLTLYSNIAFNRLAFTIIKLYKADERFLNPILSFCFEVAKNYAFNAEQNLNEIFQNLFNFVLETSDYKSSSSTKRNIQSSDENKIIWNQNLDYQKSVWEKNDGNFSIYFKILEAFISGLLLNTDYIFTFDEKETFILQKK